MTSENVKGREEEFRKLQFSGKSSYMLALPKKWVEEMGLKAGDQVTVSRQGSGSLMVSPTSGKMYGSKSEAVIVVPSNIKPPSLTRRIVSIYLLGYNVITVRGKDRTLSTGQREAVKDALRRHLIGTEVIADSTEGITLQVLLSYPELTVKNVVKRMFLIAASMHKDAMLALRDFSKDTANGIVRSDDEVDRFSLYAIRQLNMAIQSDLVLRELDLETRRDCLDYRLIVKSIERVADHAVKIAQAILSLPEPLSATQLSGISKMSDYALGLFDESSLSLFKRDYDAADGVVERAERAAQMQQDLLKSLEKQRAPGAKEIPLIIEDVRRTAEYSGDIAETVLNMITEGTVITEESKL